MNDLAAIAHLDFEPDTTPDKEFTKLKECMIVNCTKVATWQGIFRCCMTKFVACNTHKEVTVRTKWNCRTCGNKTRENAWIGWAEL